MRITLGFHQCKKPLELMERLLAAVPELRGVRFAAALVRRTAAGGIFYRYFGGPNHTQPIETWSSIRLARCVTPSECANRLCSAPGYSGCIS